VAADRDFEAVIVGASVAGCTAARLYAERGARVALVEKRPDIDAHKTVCTHFIQSSATSTIEKLGLAPLIEERGAVRNSVDLWTPYGGWIPHRGDTPYGYNVTRRVLDPLLRRMTADTPGVELMLGATATALIPGGVVVEDRARARRELRGRLVVAADGRDTRLARMAGVPGRTTSSSPTSPRRARRTRSSARCTARPWTTTSSGARSRRSAPAAGRR
jgi:menaquinone-9 beta-reductase